MASKKTKRKHATQKLVLKLAKTVGYGADEAIAAAHGNKRKQRNMGLK